MKQFPLFSTQQSFERLEDNQLTLPRLYIPKKKNKDVYTKKANALISHKKSNNIKIDHLAFTLPISALRHCRKAGAANTATKIITGTKKSFFSDKEVTQTKLVKSHGIWPQPPVIKSVQTVGIDEYEAHKKHVDNQMRDFYEKTLIIWVNEVLGFELSPMRGKGFQGYKDSMTLRSFGKDIGFVAIGGQRETIHFQISGTGCKSLFEHTTPFVLHHWLSKVFSITKLRRVDLCFDDFDNNFNCDYAEKAYIDGFFRTSNRGPSPQAEPRNKYTYETKLNKLLKVFTQEMFCVGSRTSAIYWRIYDKKLEQGIKEDDLTWYRSEAELKKWDIDCLLNLGATFAGLCPFSASIDLDKGIKTKAMSKAKEVCLDVAARVRHVRRSAGKALGDILEIFQGDIEHTMGLILPEETGGKLGIPSTYQQLINTVIEV
ncbi:MAG: phage replication protein [Gammaproteobacteria bacterium]|nr:MAG: phage replication protein [Gammaproteobacteria bacterium]